MRTMTMTMSGLLSLDTLTRFFKVINAKRLAYLKLRLTIRELSSLSDNELKDIGLCRGDIYSIAAGTFRRDASPQMRSRLINNDNLTGWV